MELKLFPGEYLTVYRAAATAGSQIAVYARLIESALPLYEEFEPQIQRKMVSARPSNIGRGIAGRQLPGRPPGGGVPPGGGGGEVVY